nr:MAG TPA: hypothetical protein [Caudoviricetes sp.]
MLHFGRNTVTKMLQQMLHQKPQWYQRFRGNCNNVTFFPNMVIAYRRYSVFCAIAPICTGIIGNRFQNVTFVLRGLFFLSTQKFKYLVKSY